MKLSSSFIASVLSAYGLSLSKEELTQLETRVNRQNHLIKMLETGADLESFALIPKWIVIRESEQMGTTHSNQGSVPFPYLDEGRARSPTNAVEKSLRLIEVHPDSNVFIKVFKERAREEAKELEKRGDSHLPLWGTTASIKDLIAISGYPMTGGSRVLDQSPSEYEATVVSRLRKAGTIVIGAANLHELAFGTTSENPHFGTVVNPIDKNFLAGGSSGGSAAAVGFGMSSFALGTDTGGSVRIPAACCGIVGFKPSFNLLPLEGVFPLGHTLDHLGPLTNSVSQAALTVEIMADKPGLLTSDLNGAIDELKIGVPANFFLEGIQEEVRSAYQKALDQLGVNGASLISVKLPYHKLAPAVYFCTSSTEAIEVHFQRIIEQGSKLGKDVYIRLLACLFIPAYARVRAQRVRYKMYLELHDIFKKVDVLATPTLPITVPQKGQKTVEVAGHSKDVTLALLRNTSPFDLTGVPAITLPFGKDKKGMPHSLQLAGPYGKDNLLLQASHAVEKALS